jgi:nitroreductase/NAD-dependent dihydropyrimidine dehydrogenase PreA subunit
MPLLTIDPKLCKKDGLCVRICQNVFEQDGKGSVPLVAHEQFCNGCGHCVMVCPAGAIRHADFSAEKIHPVRNEIIPAYEAVREMIVTRRSVRTFQDKPVGEEVIERVVEGARFAPTAKNSQSTEFIVVQDNRLLRAVASATAQWLGKLAKRLKNPLWRRLYMLHENVAADGIARYIGLFDLVAEKMAKGTDRILFEAPVLLLFHADKTIRLADVNANLAVQNATLIASSLGLGSFYTGYVVLACRQEKTIPRLLGLPPKHEVYGGMAFGYPKIGFPRWVERNPAKIKWM